MIVSMLLPMSPLSSMFLMVETRENPMHVGSLQLYRPPEGKDAIDVRTMFERASRRRRGRSAVREASRGAR